MSNRFGRIGLVAIALGLVLAACDGGDGSGLPTPAGSFAADFSAIQANVFTPSCATSGCHFGAGAPLGLSLDAANSYALLVGVASSQQSSLLRVAPGNPGASYLIRKLEGSAATGGQMPLNAAALPQSTIDTIRQWIADGAIDDRAASDDPIRVTSLQPVPGAVLAEAPDQVTVAFDREPDASTVNEMTVQLDASGGDGDFSDGDEISLTAQSLVVPAANTRSVVFELPTNAPADDEYRLSIRASGPSLLLDLSGNALDGEFSGSFPSGDGVEGGDFVATFDVSPPVPPEATLDAIQDSVFSVSCAFSGCHSGPTGDRLPTGLDLTSADASFQSLVGVASLQQPAILRVAAGDPDGSYLIQKLEDTAASGQQMPFGADPLAPEVIANIRLWIANGANRQEAP